MPRLHSDRQLRQPKGRWHIFQSLFFIFVFSLAIFFFLQSSFFKVTDIKVSGNKQLKKEDIISLAGFKKGINIFKANLQLAQGKVTLHPMIKQVEMTRKLPGIIIINITERKPVGMLADKGRFVVVSEDGCFVIKANSLSSINLPIITGIKLGSEGPGQKIADENLKVALNYLLTMPLNFRAAVSEVNVSDLNNIRVFTLDRVEVRFGDNSRIAEKVRLYQGVISQKYESRIEYIDISYKGSPVIKFTVSGDRKKQSKQ